MKNTFSTPEKPLNITDSTEIFIRLHFLKNYTHLDMKEEPVTQDSNALVKKINPSWHGRMLASRGVMASMNEEQLLQFDKEHRAMLEEKHPLVQLKVKPQALR